jgi:rhodanese-related sulfurtransferase
MTAEPIEVSAARTRQRAGELIIDVREPADYAKGHIAGAVNIPIGRLADAELPDGPIMTACGGGGRAGRAAAALGEAGREAYSIKGGTRAWEAAGMPIESPRD